MVTLPTPTFYWRNSGAGDADWTLDADGLFSPTDGQTVEVVTVGPSQIATITADTTPTISGLQDLSASYASVIAINAAAAASGTNLQYSITGPSWLDINASTGQITGTAPSSDGSGTTTVTVSNSAGSASDSFAYTVAAGPPAPILQPIILIGASNTAGGDDSAGAVLTSADSPAGVVAWDVNNGDTGAIAAIDIAGVGIPRPGGYQTNASLPASTSPAINFAAEIAAANGVTCVLIPCAVGGRGVYAGGDVVGEGPWDPSGTGAAWDPNDIIGTTTTAWGSLYKAVAADAGAGNSLIKAAWEAALAASAYSGHTVADPIYFGYPGNENDTACPFDEFVSRSRTCINDIRAMWGAGPWVSTMGPPEWIFGGPLSRSQISTGVFQLANELDNFAFVEGVTGNQHATEAIHYNNAGYRLLGTKAAAALTTATSRTAVDRGIDWIDGITAKPDRYYSLYRGLSTYSGAAIEISNGTTAIDVNFLASGYLDADAVLAHGTDCHVTKVYDQMGSGSTLVPDTAVALTMPLTVASEFVTQGNRLAFGNDVAQMFTDSSVTTGTDDALLFAGMIISGGTTVALSGAQNTVGIAGFGGNITFAPGSALEPQFDVAPTFEPAWAVNGYGMFSFYLDAPAFDVDGGMYDGDTIVPSSGNTGVTYGQTTGLGLGGRVGATNRYGRGNYVAAAWWATAPTGADRTAVLAAAQAFKDRGDIEVT